MNALRQALAKGHELFMAGKQYEATPEGLVGKVVSVMHTDAGMVVEFVTAGGTTYTRPIDRMVRVKGG